MSVFRAFYRDAVRFIQHLGLGAGRRLLALWTHVTVLPDGVSTLELDPDKPVCFVLETDSFSNLLILEQTCARYKQLPAPSDRLPLATADDLTSYFPLLHFEGFFRRRLSHRYPPVLSDIVTLQREHHDQEVLLVPVSIFWGRRPDKEGSLIKLWFSETWVRVGRIRKFLIILLHGRNIWLQFSRPVSLSEFLDTCPDSWAEDRVARKLGRVLRVHFQQRRRAAIGPELSRLHSFVKDLLESRTIKDEIEREAQRTGISVAKAQTKARSYAYEIAAAMSYPFLLIMRRLLRRLWDRLYDGVELGPTTELRDAVAGNTVVYLPCHRSHIDYLLLSYVLFEQGLSVPHVAAGINLNIPVVGPLLRRGGAFFLRRSFKGNRLYGAVFHRYLSMSLAKGAPLEYFIEGGRSRSGLSLMPKAGMLDMTVRSFLAYPDQRMRLVLIPVYIGYEKLVEGASYVAELSGAPKSKETLGGFFRSLRGLRSQFGKVHLNFSRPLYLEDFLNQKQPDWRYGIDTFSERDRPTWLPGLIDQLATETMTRINEAAAITPVGLLAISLLAAPGKKLLRNSLEEYLTFLVAMNREVPFSSYTTLTSFSVSEIIAHGVTLGFVEEVLEEDSYHVRVQEKKAGLLQNLANNILHVFSLPATVAGTLLSDESVCEQQLFASLRKIYPALRAQFFLPWPEDQLAKRASDTLEFFVAKDVIRYTTQRYYTTGGDRPKMAARDGVNGVHSLSLLAGSMQLLPSVLEK